MINLLAGVDVSGRPGVGNYTYIAIVIGTDESINRILNHLGQGYIHMNRIKNNQTQDKIISKLFFDHKQNQAWCIKIDMDSIISDCLNLIKNKKRRISRVKLVRIFHYYLLKLIRSKIEDFLIQYSCSLYDIYFECDSDCRNFIKQNGLRHTDIGKAHTIADIVAWANNRNKEPIGALSLDLTDDIRKTIYKYIKK